MKAVVIGGCGHIGTYLVPRLVENGYETTVVSRGQSEPYVKSGIWNWVTRVRLDRTQEEQAGSFGRAIAALDADVVVDLIAFKNEALPAMRWKDSCPNRPGEKG